MGKTQSGFNWDRNFICRNVNGGPLDFTPFNHPRDEDQVLSRELNGAGLHMIDFKQFAFSDRLLARLDEFEKWIYCPRTNEHALDGGRIALHVQRIAKKFGKGNPGLQHIILAECQAIIAKRSSHFTNQMKVVFVTDAEQAARQSVQYRTDMLCQRALGKLEQAVKDLWWRRDLSAKLEIDERKIEARFYGASQHEINEAVTNGHKDDN